MAEPFAVRSSRPSSSKKADDGSLIDFRHILSALRERWLGALLLSVLLAGTVGYLLLMRPAVYAASTTLLVERSNDRVVDIKQVVDTTVESSLTDALLLTHIQQIQSHTFFVRVIASLTPEERAKTLESYPQAPPKNSTDPVPSDESRLESIIEKGLKVERAGRTLLIKLTVRHRSPEVAPLLANRLADQYILHLINRSTDSNDSALAFLNAQAEELRRRVEDSEHGVQAYRERHNLVFLEQNQNILIDRLRSISASASQARVKRLEVEARVAQIEQVLSSDEEAARQLSSRPEFVAFADVQRRMDDLRALRSTMANRYGPNHPSMKQNAVALESLDTLRKQQITAALSDIRSQRERAITEDKQLSQELVAAEKESLRLDQLAVEYNVLRRAVETTRQTYDVILARLNETTVSSRLQNTNIKSIDRAGVPQVPVEPNRLKIYAISCVLGLFMFIGYPLLGDLLDNRLKTWSDVENHMGASLLAEIPSAKKVAQKDRGWIVARSLNQDIVEGFRGLYSQLQITHKIDGPRTIVVTSTVPGEGKSFVVSNLASSFSAHGRRTLVIDADFRLSAQHTAFNIGNEAGTLRWVAAGASIDGDLLTNKELGIVKLLPNLHLLRSGGKSRNLTELLEDGTLSKLLDALKTQFDIIIFDTPPAGVFPDAEVVARLADQVIFVSRFKGVNRAHAQQVLSRLNKLYLPLAGVVLNGMPAGRAGFYHFSGQGYYASRYGKHYTEK